MSKELTEQWRKGTLPRGGYYIKLRDGSIKQTDYENISKTFDTTYFRYNVSVKEVLAPVPSFADLCELKQELEICKEEKADLYAKLCNALKQLEEYVQKVHILNEANMKLENTVGKFGEQLEEANDLLKGLYDASPCQFDHLGYCQEHGSTDGNYICVQGELKEYLERWGVK